MSIATEHSVFSDWCQHLKSRHIHEHRKQSAYIHTRTSLRIRKKYFRMSRRASPRNTQCSQTGASIYGLFISMLSPPTKKNN